MSGDLAAFLAARYDEAEALAKTAEADWDAEHAMYEWNDLPDAAFAYARNLSPKHRLADIKLKRAILAEHTPITVKDGPYAGEPVCGCCGAASSDAWYAVGSPCATARQLGTEFAEHAGYRPEWRPE